MDMMYIPYNQQADPNSYIAQGLQNLLGGLLQQRQQNRGQQQWQQMLGGFPQQQGINMQALMALKDPRMQQMAAAMMGGQMMNPLQESEITLNQAQAVKNLQPSEISVGDLESQYLQGLPQEERNAVLQQKLTKPGVSVNISAGEREQMAQSESAYKLLDNLGEAYTRYTEKGGYSGTKGHAGIGMDTYTQKAGSFGLTTKMTEDLRVASALYRNRLIKEFAGTNVSAQEQVRMLDEVPTISDPPTRFKSKLVASKANIRYLQAMRKKNFPQPSGKTNIQDEIDPLGLGL